MDLYTAMRERHSVRAYKNRPIEAEKVQKLQAEIDACNREGNLHLQLVTNEPNAFTGMMARYGSFRGVQNYIAVVGAKSDDLHERAGYYGERVVLLAQTLGLNTCWVALTYSKHKAKIEIAKGEKSVCVIALGYGEKQGVPHKNKPTGQLCSADGEMPDWFKAGMEAAMLAPTAVNQQKFHFALTDGGVHASAPAGAYTKLDLGIAKYHFELGAGKENFRWV